MRVVIADDSALLREGLARLLAEAGHEVVALAADAPSLVAAVREHRPDLAVIDIRMPPDLTDDGLRAAVQLRSEFSELAVLVLSQYIEAAYAQELFGASGGGAGYLLKDRVADLDALIRALETIASGGTVLDPEVITALMRRRDDPLAGLSPRERQVLELMAQGRSNTAICEELVLSTGTVDKHVGAIFTKLGLLPSTEDHRRVLAVLAWLRQT